MTTPLVVSFWTPEYDGELKGFRESAAEHGYKLATQGRPSFSSWRLNCGMKPQFILQMLDVAQAPVLWVDIDARFKGPWDLGAIEDRCDFACWFIPYDRMRAVDIPGGPSRNRDGLASGTMFFNTTAHAAALLRAWIASDHGQHAFEQMVLGEAWYDSRPELRTERLPQRYCKVFDSPWFKAEKGPVVIEHTQASRRLRRLVDTHR